MSSFDESEHAYLTVAEALKKGGFKPEDLGRALPFFLSFRVRGDKKYLEKQLKDLTEETLRMRDEIEKDELLRASLHHDLPKE